MERNKLRYTYPESTLTQEAELTPVPESTSTILGDLALKFLIGHSLTPHMFGLRGTEASAATSAINPSDTRPIEALLDSVYIAETVPTNKKR